MSRSGTRSFKRTMKRKTKPGRCCECCGVFCRAKFCGQCKFAGCDTSKRGAKCRLAMGAQLSRLDPSRVTGHESRVTEVLK
jgi:hypothetical protein